MTQEEKEKLYSTYELLSITELSYEQISTFKCVRNSDLENFILSTALDYEERQISRTFVLFDSTSDCIVGYFTLSIKSLSTNGMSKSVIKKIDGISKSRACIHCYLLGQLGISDPYDKFKLGTLLLDDAYEIIKNARVLVAGRIILVDAVNHKKVIDFYEKNDFVILRTDEDGSDTENIKMIYKI